MMIIYTWRNEDGTKDVDFVIETECPRAEYILNKADCLRDASAFLDDFDNEEERRYEYELYEYDIPYDKFVKDYDDGNFKNIATKLFEEDGYAVTFHNFVECARN